jgi:tRNA A-37 threonylcarbamoyl transferase component Bud32
MFALMPALFRFRSKWTLRSDIKPCEEKLINETRTKLVRDDLQLSSSSETKTLIVKTNHQRTVALIQRNNASWYRKDCIVDGPRAWFRELFRGAKAKLEFENAIKLEKLGIPAIQAIAWEGRRWPGRSSVISRAVENAVPLDQFLESKSELFTSVKSNSARCELARTLGQWFAQMYKAGVCHPDPHPGNFLISHDQQSLLHNLTLTDLHAIQFDCRGQHKMVDNLVLLNRWFTLRASKTDRARFWKAFSRNLQLNKQDAKQLAIEIERKTLQSNIVFWERRFGRYFGKNREYLPIRNRDQNSLSLAGMIRRECPKEIVDLMLDNPDHLLDQGQVLKKSASSQVVLLKLGDVSYILKRVPIRQKKDIVKNIFRSSSIRKSWMYGQSLNDRWLPTPKPLLMLHRYRLGMPCEGYLLTPAIANAQTLHELNLHQLPMVCFKLAKLLRRMHDHGVSHRDLKANNILVSGEGEPSLIDLVGISTAKNISLDQRYRDLARLAASFVNSNKIRHADRVNFLRSYGFEDWKTAWRAMAKIVEKKIVQNQKRNRILA